MKRRGPSRAPVHGAKPPRRSCLAVALAMLLLAATAAGPAVAADRLPGMNARLAGTTVSGLSSGGYMAVQFHVAHSGIVRGAGVLAAGPYFCAQGSAWTALVNCMKPTRLAPVPDVRRLAAAAASFAAAGAIDPPAHLAASRAWLFSGTRDTTVERAVVEALERFYREFMQPGAIVVVDTLPAGHAMVTVDAGDACPVTRSPFINDCDYDAAGKLLEHVAGPLEPRGIAAPGRFVRFDQNEFAGGAAESIGMDRVGFAYIPSACDAAPCRVHVAFHGCGQGFGAAGERFVRDAGYNAWAETNRMIVLYPQAVATNAWAGGFRTPRFVFNPRGCWDWWGYTGPLYATRSGPQIRAVRAMLDRLAAPAQTPRD